MDDALGATQAAIESMKDAADSGRMAYSQMIASGNVGGNKMVQDAMDALVGQTRAIEAVAASLHVKIASTGSDRNARGP